MDLGEVIRVLSEYPADKVVEMGFGEPMSYRGYYDNLAFEPVVRTTVGDMLAHARSAVGQVFTGYKGGRYRMTERTPVWVAPYGETVGDELGCDELRRMVEREPYVRPVDMLAAEMADRQAAARQEAQRMADRLARVERELSEVERELAGEFDEPAELNPLTTARKVWLIKAQRDAEADAYNELARQVCDIVGLEKMRPSVALELLKSRVEARGIPFESLKSEAPKPASGKFVLCVDFDGVLHFYTSGWRGADVITDGPVPGAMAWLADVTSNRRFEVCIYSSRSKEPGGIDAMKRWLESALTHDVCSEIAEETLTRLSFPTTKPAASLMIDDRAFLFEGVFPSVSEMLAFKPWNKR
jgi:hypothetical protein